MLVDLRDDIVPLLIPAKYKTALAIRLVLMKSKEDKDLFEVLSQKSLLFTSSRKVFLFLSLFSRINYDLAWQRELQNLEEEDNKKLRGFREVVELISASQKPVLSYNCLNGLSPRLKILSLVLTF